MMIKARECCHLSDENTLRFGQKKNSLRLTEDAVFFVHGKSGSHCSECPINPRLQNQRGRVRTNVSYW